MKLKTEEIVKILLILGVLYLLFNCDLTEKFSDTPDRIKIALISDKQVYNLVSFFNLKDEYKIALLKNLNNEYIIENDKNSKLDSAKKTSNSFFLFGGKEDKFIEISNSDDNLRNNLDKIKTDSVSKIPMLIIPRDKISEYTNDSIVDFVQPKASDKGLSTEHNNYLFWNPAHGLIFTSGKENLKFEIKGLNLSSDKNKLDVEAIKDGDKDITPKNLKPVTIKGNKEFTHYVLSNSEGKPFTMWKWYTDDLSKIQ